MWVRLLIVAFLPTIGAAAGFDCGKASTDAEKMICADADLSALDAEVARLYALAQTSSHAGEDQLKAMQRGFIKGREECWKADDRRLCLRDETAIRIAELRQGYAEARLADDAGISTGPFALECDGTDFGIAVTFINASSSLAYLAWRDIVLVLAATAAGSGVHYVGAASEGEYSLWTKGPEAMLTLPGEDPRHCAIVQPG